MGGKDLRNTKLAKRIREVAYLKGNFDLRSDRKSSYYIDKYLFETDPEILYTLGEMFAEYAHGSTLIAGAELGGVPLAVVTSLITGKPFVIIRNKKKNYGTGRFYEGKLTNTDRVLLVEDITTTGGQVLEAAKLIVRVGAIVERIVAVVDRQEGAREKIEVAGFVFESLFTKSDLGIKV